MRGLLPQIRREVRIMYSLTHPNIIKLYNHFEDDDNFYLIMEIAEGGTLFKALRKRKTLDERSTAQFMREVALAVQYLHQRYPPIIHRDIKPENILLDSEGTAKLSDFGWSNFNNDERDTYCGTLEYLAPEMIARTGHGIELDLWNLGILLFELLAGRPPFESKSQTELLTK
jgi:serine/threonine protein kinase